MRLAGWTGDVRVPGARHGYPETTRFLSTFILRSAASWQHRHLPSEDLGRDLTCQVNFVRRTVVGRGLERRHALPPISAPPKREVVELGNDQRRP